MCKLSPPWEKQIRKRRQPPRTNQGIWSFPSVLRRWLSRQLSPFLLKFQWPLSWCRARHRNALVQHLPSHPFQRGQFFQQVGIKAFGLHSLVLKFTRLSKGWWVAVDYLTSLLEGKLLFPFLLLTSSTAQHTLYFGKCQSQTQQILFKPGVGKHFL